MNDFVQGVTWVFRGIEEFFRHPRLWRFVALPWLLVLAIYILLFHVVLSVWMPQMLAATREFFVGSWFEFLYRLTELFIKVGVYLFLAVLTAFFSGNLLEILGGFCFSRMVRYYETQILHCEIVSIPPKREFGNLAERGIFSAVTMMLYLFLFIAGFFLPVIAPLAMIILVGYRYAVTYTAEAIFNSGHRLSDATVLYSERHGLLFGFGVVAFLLFFIPLLPIVVIPGLVIGGTLMYHHRRD